MCSAGDSAALHSLLDQLLQVESFYDSIGGLLGYQRQCLQLLIANAAQPQDPVQEQQVRYHMPQGLDLASYHSRQAAVQTVATGLEALPHMAEIYPLGGAGDRLGLQCAETGECMPAAVLPYCGRTMLEGLMRDLQVRHLLFTAAFIGAKQSVVGRWYGGFACPWLLRLSYEQMRVASMQGETGNFLKGQL